MPDYKCLSCAQSMDGADGILRCRVHPHALPCSDALADDCKRFIYEPGTDADETTHDRMPNAQGNAPLKAVAVDRRIEQSKT